MSGVRVLVVPRKGPFALQRTGGDWGSPARISLAGGSTAWPCRMRTPADSEARRLPAGSVGSSSAPMAGGLESAGNEFAYPSEPGAHQRYDGTPHRRNSARPWHLDLGVPYQRRGITITGWQAVREGRLAIRYRNRRRATLCSGN